MAPARDRPQPRRHDGFTLVEVAIAASIAVVMVSMAWPSYQTRLTKARRADAIHALMQVQIAQEQFRAVNGVYAGTLAQLRGAGSSNSPQGLYEIVLENAAAESYGAVARARPEAAQSRDQDCPWLALRVDQGISERSPSAACWNS